MPSSTLNALKRLADKMTTDFPTAPSAYGLNGPSAAVTVEKSPHASHTEILTPPLPYLDLTFWAIINRKKIKPADMEESFFKGRYFGVPGEHVTKKVAKEAVKLISDETLYALNVELRTYGCVMPEKS